MGLELTSHDLIVHLALIREEMQAELELTGNSPLFFLRKALGNFVNLNIMLIWILTSLGKIRTLR